MTRNTFDQQLQTLNAQLIQMGASVEQAIDFACRALLEQDERAKIAARACEREVDQKAQDIQALCLSLLLRQQPVASDLRLISAAMGMITDLERIGDQAMDILELTRFLVDKPYVQQVEHLPKMASATARMVTASIDAFVHRDLSLAAQVAAMDDRVDELFSKVRAELMDLVRTDASYGEQAVDLIMIAKYFERIGDHAENIAEWVTFSITGQEPRT